MYTFRIWPDLVSIHAPVKERHQRSTNFLKEFASFLYHSTHFPHKMQLQNTVCLQIAPILCKNPGANPPEISCSLQVRTSSSYMKTNSTADFAICRIVVSHRKFCSASCNFHFPLEHGLKGYRSLNLNLSH